MQFLKKFNLISNLKSTQEQKIAVNKIVNAINKKEKHIILQGITGSGKTYMMAQVIEQINMPTIILSPNKLLAKQIFDEIKDMFPNNSVHLFISHFDFFIPESFSRKTQNYRSKLSSVNSLIESMRTEAILSSITRQDSIIVASVAAIFGGGVSDQINKITLKIGDYYNQESLLETLKEQLFYRIDNKNIFGYAQKTNEYIKIYIDKDQIIYIYIDKNNISKIICNKQEYEYIDVPQGRFGYINKNKRSKIVNMIMDELNHRKTYFLQQGRADLAKRIEDRTVFDARRISEIGWCQGMENYVLYCDPEFKTILQNFKANQFLCFLDESHIMVPQIKSMYHGFIQRIQSLVDNGFRLPSALHNVPLTFEQFNLIANQIIYVSATPGIYEKEISLTKTSVLTRPTGLIDPEIEIYQKDDVFEYILTDIHRTINNKGKCLIATTTKISAQNISEYLSKQGIRAQYLHSDLPPLDRQSVIQDIKRDRCDVVVGINLLREGVDLPELQTIYILEADKYGFLRSETSLFQLIGRVARNIYGKAIIFAKQITPSIVHVMQETIDRRKAQLKYNQENKIIPKTIIKDYNIDISNDIPYIKNREQAKVEINKLNKQIKKFIKMMEFERAEKSIEIIKNIKSNWGIE